MRRRDFIALLGGTAAALPVVARGQQPVLPIVGFLNSESADSGYGRMAEMFKEGLKEVGYIDGQNVTIEYHWADGHNDRLPAMVDDLVRRRAAVIVATTTPAAQAAKVAAATTPVVFETGGDPVQLGLVSSLNHPGGNVTGVRACPQLEDSQGDYRVIHRQSADSELTDAPLFPSR